MPEIFGAFQHFDLLSVAVATAGMFVLGFVVLFNNFSSISNRIFFFLTIAAGTWGVVNYFSYQSYPDPEFSLALLRCVIFAGIWSSFFIFMLSYTFPDVQKQFPWPLRFILVPLTAATAQLALTPFVFEGIADPVTVGAPLTVINGPGIILYGIVSALLNVGSILVLLRKTVQADRTRRKPLLLVLTGMAIMLALILTFNLVLPAFYGVTQYTPFGALFLFPFIAFTAYAIMRFRFFDIKVAGTALLVFALSVVSFAEIIFAREYFLVVFRASTFILILAFGILLIRGVLNEVRQREQIQRLAEDLKLANERQEGLLHFVGHEVKNFLTKDLGALSELVEGSYGALPDTARQFAARATEEAKKAVVSVSELLLASNQKKGTIAYKMEPFDFRALVSDAVESLKPHAAEKDLTLTFNAAEGEYRVLGDRGQLGDHVVRNLIDNAINYTLKGSISVSVARKSGFVVLSVKDTGKGIPPEDRTRLFTEGGRGKDSLKYNAHSTGYGLFITKGIIDAHKGSIRAESEGEGKGSTFIVELPVA